MSGSLYIWIIGAFFAATVGVIGVIALLLWLGHWAEKKETGAKHGFLELPMELRTPDDARTPAAREEPPQG